MENSRPDWVQKLFDDEDNFWKTEYPGKNRDERIKYWAATLYRSMRTQEESGLNIYALFTRDWLHNVLEKEPDFINMLPQIYNIWGGMFDHSKVDRLIKKMM